MRRCLHTLVLSYMLCYVLLCNMLSSPWLAYLCSEHAWVTWNTTGKSAQSCATCPSNPNALTTSCTLWASCIWEAGVLVFCARGRRRLLARLRDRVPEALMWLKMTQVPSNPIAGGVPRGA